jgi:hypothetical protein
LHRLIDKVGFTEGEALAFHHSIHAEAADGDDVPNPYALLPASVSRDIAARDEEIANLRSQVQAAEIEKLRRQLAAAQSDDVAPAAPAVPANAPDASATQTSATVTPEGEATETTADASGEEVQ